ncbi:MAG: DsbA family oxidoreductase [Zoogloeaceae bacterium]|nr:DsbA family oxidoreductase [Rhodocyclaceae bacterium]MCP5237478.1 DsbA family oxidoreductase [Zoogloeaceae bacterium]
MRIDVISDFVCPWCYLGVHRLCHALATRAGHGVPPPELVWHGFLLNPDTPAEGEPYRAFMVRKFGSDAGVDALHRRLEAEAAHDGLAFRFEDMLIRPSTLRAHALLRHLQAQHQDVLAFVLGIFRAHFIEGRNIGLADELASVARSVGVSAASLRDAVEDMPVRADLEGFARAVGASAVPVFIIDRKLVLSGAQPPSVLARALGSAAGERD